MIIAVLVLFVMQLAGYKQEVAPPAKVSVCEVLLNPSVWNGRLVEISGVVDYGLRDVHPCSKPFVTEGHRWPEAIDYVGYSGPDDQTPNVSSGMTFSRFREKVDSVLRRGESPTTITAAFIGRMITREKYVRVTTGYGLLGNGFGHLNVYLAQLQVMYVKNLDIQRTERGQGSRRTGPIEAAK